ncbi:hypothetical protein [Streptomyces sp. CA-111067]|uniref:hypothetical protein n=1 Tax=Streptomyces sp. CA-111067 TaxID=3240046 RepID=UPI003D98EB72
MLKLTDIGIATPTVVPVDGAMVFSSIFGRCGVGELFGCEDFGAGATLAFSVAS